ncbi:MAG: hypothetical protein U0136_20030 [Bdellovibrionota bacterium]
MSEKEFQNLDNAIGLVEMLEFMMNNCSEQSTAYQEVPWKGMKLTLERLRMMLVDARRSVPAEPVERRTRARVDERTDELADDPDEELALPQELAHRIQMAPLPRPGRRGYSREVSAGQTSKSQETVRVDS